MGGDQLKIYSNLKLPNLGYAYIFTQKIDLLPFMILGGDYTFSLEKYKFKRYLEFYDSNSETSSKYIRINLPNSVNGFKLYTGSFGLKNNFCVLRNKTVNKNIIIGKE